MSGHWTIPDYTIDAPAQDVRTFADFYSWGPDKLGLAPALKEAGGQRCLVAILDTNGARNHTALPEAIEYKIWTGESSGNDGNSHGTHCWGTVFEWAPKADFAIHKVLTNGGSGSTGGIARAIKHLTKRWVEEWRGKKYSFLIVSMSLGGSYSQDIDQAMAEGSAEGIIYVCAAGNNGRYVEHPGSSAYTGLCVGAIDKNLVIADFSSRGTQVTIAMPGVGIVSTVPGNKWQPMSGTSMATPAAAGLTATLLSSMPHRIDLRDARKLRQHFAEHCTDKGPAGHDTAYGFGIPVPTGLVNFDPFRMG